MSYEKPLKFVSLLGSLRKHEQVHWRAAKGRLNRDMKG